MPRGQAAEIGTKRVAQNGYEYTRLSEGWVLTSRMLAEAKLGRKLTINEYVTYSDGDRNNLKPENLIVQLRERTSLARRLAHVNARIVELTALKIALEKKIKAQEKLGS